LATPQAAAMPCFNPMKLQWNFFIFSGRMLIQPSQMAMLTFVKQISAPRKNTSVPNATAIAAVQSRKFHASI
jgi:hypothetical protein